MAIGVERCARGVALALAIILFVAVVCARSGVSHAAATAIVVDAQSHLGVASCAGSTCHGRQVATGAVVRQDELRIWQDSSSPTGAHSRAWQALGGGRGRAIAARLGIGDPQNAAQCLGCHSEGMAPVAFRDDGVGCEGCHGGARRWLASHYAVAATHAQNVARGMVALDRPAVRAGVCLDCHYGSGKSGQFVDHRIMAAGHPRLSFELDLFSTMQKHWNEDGDYAARKSAPNAATLWAVGQAEALGRALDLLAARGTRGVFPELAFFDCQSCHRRISDAPDYRPDALANPGRGVPVGTPPFQDENMIMLSAAARVAAPDLAGRLDRDSLAFHQAMLAGGPQTAAAGARLRETARALADRFAEAPLGPRAVFAMIAALADRVEAPRFTDYEGSVQAVMAIDTLLSALADDGAVTREAAARVRPDIDGAYAAVHEPNAYQPLAFRAALGRATNAIGALQ